MWLDLIKMIQNTPMGLRVQLKVTLNSDTFNTFISSLCETHEMRVWVKKYQKNTFLTLSIQMVSSIHQNWSILSLFHVTLVTEWIHLLHLFFLSLFTLLFSSLSSSSSHLPFPGERTTTLDWCEWHFSCDMRERESYFHAGEWNNTKIRVQSAWISENTNFLHIHLIFNKDASVRRETTFTTDGR